VNDGSTFVKRLIPNDRLALYGPILVFYCSTCIVLNMFSNKSLKSLGV